MTNKGEDASGAGQPSDKDKRARPDSWISDLARRSSGLPGDEKPAPKSAEPAEKGPWKLAGLGIQLATTTLLFALMGWALDKRMGWSPWGVVVLVLIAVVGNMYLLIKESLKDERKAKK